MNGDEIYLALALAKDSGGVLEGDLKLEMGKLQNDTWLSAEASAVRRLGR